MSTTDTTTVPTAHPSRASVPWVVTLAAWLILLVTLVGFGGRFWWVLGLIAPFRFQLLMVSLFMLLVMLLGLRWRRWEARSALAAALVSVLINALLVAPLWLPAPASPGGPSDGPKLTLMAVNLFVGNGLLDDVATAGPVAHVIEDSGAAVVLIQEITVHRLGVLGRALPQYRIVSGTGRPDAFGIALLVHRQAELTIESVKEIDLTAGLTSVKQIELRGQWQGRPLSLLGVHTISAVHATSDRFRAAMLSGAAQWANRQRSQGRAVIVCGDLNATPWCAPFREMLSESQLLNSQRGFGLQGSWPSRLPAPLRLAIDHCVHSDDLVTLVREIGPRTPGSDHLPLTVQLQWR